MALASPRALGVVLAGGRSTRFGSEKAVALVDGAPMVARVAAVLARGCEAVAVNAAADSGAADWARAGRRPVLPDPSGAPDGPLAGVLAGLAWAQAQGGEVLVTSPCDTPDLPHDLVRRLLHGLGEAQAAVATTSHGSHPLCAAWRVELAPRLRAELERGHPSVRDWLAAVGAREVRFGRTLAFRNLNRPPRRRPWITCTVDVLALGLLTVLSLVAVVALLFAFSFGDAVDAAGQARHDAQARVASAVGLALTIGVVAAVARLGGRARRR